MLYLYVILILVSETLAITFLKKFSLNSIWYYFLLGLAFYAMVAFFLTKSFKYGDMGIVNVLWSAFSVLFVVGVGYFYFKEHINLVELGGMSLIVMGVVVLRFYGV